MERTENSQRRHSLFVTAAALAPVTQAASQEAWPMVTVMAAVAYILGRWCAYGTGWVLGIQRVWSAVLISVMMRWSTYFWAGLPFCKAVPWILLLLALWAARVPGKPQQIGCVLIWPLLLLLGAVLLSGISEIRLEHLQPEWGAWDLTLLAMLLLPSLGQKNGRAKIAIGAVLICLITTGVLSTAVSRSVPSGIYELSRSLSLLGMAERFESLIAAAMTMGFFSSFTRLLEPPREEKISVWICAGIAGGLYLIGAAENGWFLGVGSVLMWVLLPWIQSPKIFSKKGKKPIDKTDIPW